MQCTQGSVTDLLLLNVYFSDILRLIPEDYAYAGDYTLSFTYEEHDSTTTVEHINVLSPIISWGLRWQVTMAPDKTQVFLISCQQNPLIQSINIDEKTLDLTRAISILGV